MIYLLVKASGENKYDVIEVRDTEKGLGREERYPAFFIFRVLGNESDFKFYQSGSENFFKSTNFSRGYIFKFDSIFSQTVLNDMENNPEFHPEISHSDIYKKE